MIEKGVQIVLPENKNGKSSKEEFLNVLRLIAPGTNLRTGLENIVKAGKGAIIVVGNEQLNSIIDGGFKINARVTPQRLLELSKMDGAIILSKDMKKIMNANVHLTPDSKIKTNETGMESETYPKVCAGKRRIYRNVRRFCGRYFCQKEKSIY